MRWNISNPKVWMFRGLVAVAAGLIVTSAILPWWTCTIDIPFTGGIEASGVPHIKIYQYGLRHILVQLAEYIAADETPFYQTVLA